MTVITDDFNRSDGAIGSSGEGWSWTAIGGTVRVNSNACDKSDNNTLNTFVRAESDLASDEHYAQCKMVEATTGYIGPVVRFAAAATTGYHMFGDATDVYIVKVVAGTPTTLTSASSGGFAANDVYKLTVTGGATTTLKAYINGVEKASVDDSSSPITGNTRCGIQIYSTSRHCDDFEAGDLAASGGGARRRRLIALGII